MCVVLEGGPGTLDVRNCLWQAEELRDSSFLGCCSQWCRTNRSSGSSSGVPGSERVCRCLGEIQTNLPALLQTIYNAITNGTPCVIVEGSGRVADVIAQVANLPVARITIALIQKKLSVLFQDTYELFTESKLVEWTKKVSPLQASLSVGRLKRSQGSQWEV